jgi:hypothetical protein
VFLSSCPHIGVGVAVTVIAIALAVGALAGMMSWLDGSSEGCLRTSMEIAAQP